MHGSFQNALGSHCCIQDLKQGLKLEEQLSQFMEMAVTMSALTRRETAITLTSALSSPG